MDTCGLERVERFRINLNEKNFASQKDNLTSSLPQRCRAVGTYGSGNDTLVNVSHVRAAAQLFELICRGFLASVTRLWPVLHGSWQE
jgi:hypothetical protein